MLASTQFRIPVDFGVIGPIGRAIFVILGGKNCCRIEWMDEWMMERMEHGTSYLEYRIRMNAEGRMEIGEVASPLCKEIGHSLLHWMFHFPRAIASVASVVCGCIAEFLILRQGRRGA